MRLTRLRAHRLELLGVFTVLATCDVSGQTPSNLDDLLRNVGERVRQYYARAQSLVCTEKVDIQQIRADLSPVGPRRVLEFELRIEWTPPADGVSEADAKVVRRLLKVNGRPPKPRDVDDCLDPKAVTPEPLAMLLPHNREVFRFAWSTKRSKNRGATLVDYRSLSTAPVEASFDENCINISAPSYSMGRVWIDPATQDVVRLDEQLTGMLEYTVPRKQRRANMPDHWIVDRADSTTRYRVLTFRDPHESILLPESVESVVIFRDGVSHHKRQTFTDYRRFLTGARVVK